MNIKAFAASTLLATAVAVPGVVTASQEMAQKNNCLACHSVDAKVVGPAFKDIAAKYQGDAGAVDALVGKVKGGGSGVWGQIPMPPNPMVSDDDAKALVEWILSL